MGHMAEWTARKYSKAEIDRAGAALVRGRRREQQPDEFESQWIIADNWRTSHAIPLTEFQAGLQSRVRRVDEELIVAHRIKRMPSILNKLERQPTMKLTQMQDLGGCRAIMPDINTVDEVYGMYRG